MASINIPGNFKYFTSTSSFNINSITYLDNLSRDRKKITSSKSLKQNLYQQQLQIDLLFRLGQIHPLILLKFYSVFRQ